MFTPPRFAVDRGVALPPDFTLLQVVPELETGGAEQTTLDVAHAVVKAGGKALVATRGGRMASRLEADGGRLAEMPVQSKNPLTMLGNAARLVDLIRREKVSIVHARSRAPAFSALPVSSNTFVSSQPATPAPLVHKVLSLSKPNCR